jgi:hypothetical protein
MVGNEREGEHRDMEQIRAAQKVPCIAANSPFVPRRRRDTCPKITRTLRIPQWRTLISADGFGAGVCATDGLLSVAHPAARRHLQKGRAEHRNDPLAS